MKASDPYNRVRSIHNGKRIYDQNKPWVTHASPDDGIDPIDKWYDVQTVGKPGEYYLIYSGRQAPGDWLFELPKDQLEEGMKFRVEIIDTWNMTITALDDPFTITANHRYRYNAAGMPRVKLPGKQYIALRIQRVE